MSTTSAKSSDLGAALTGLIVGAVALFIIVFTIVKLTNSSYAGEHPAAPAAATTTGTPAPAPPAAH